MLSCLFMSMSETQWKNSRVNALVSQKAHDESIPVSMFLFIVVTLSLCLSVLKYFIHRLETLNSKWIWMSSVFFSASIVFSIFNVPPIPFCHYLYHTVTHAHWISPSALLNWICYDRKGKGMGGGIFLRRKANKLGANPHLCALCL